MTARTLSLISLAIFGFVFAATAFWPSPEVDLGTPGKCRQYGGISLGWPASPTAGMREVSLGTMRLWIDATEVTNAQFAAFVEATGYITVAERRGASPVFSINAKANSSEFSDQDSWWRLQPDANWRNPNGLASEASPPNFPVVHIARADASAYAAWLGNRLPTEAEWQTLVSGQVQINALPSCQVP